MSRSVRTFECRKLQGRLAAMLPLLFLGAAENADAAQVESPVAPPDEAESVLQAEQPATSDAIVTPPSPAAGETSSWEVSITPYIWFSGLSGDVGVFPRLQPVKVDLGFSDIFDHLKFGGMVALQARHGRFVALGDMIYIHLGASKNIDIRNPGFVDVDLDLSSLSSTAAGGYRAVENGSLILDLLAGFRLTVVDTSLDLIGPNRAATGKSSETWADPVVGVRLLVPLTKNWSFGAYGDIGGFGVSSDLTWQLLGTIQYDLGKHWKMSAGWRYYEIDYKNDGFVYDVSMSGPILGISYRF